MTLKKPMIVFGTRPEAIKMAPVISEFMSRGIEPIVICVQQSEDLLDQVIPIFPWLHGVDPIALPSHHATMSRMETVVIGAIDIVGQAIRHHKPDVVLVHGDTSTAFGAGIAAFYEGVPLGHVEAGLRTGDIRNPFPEEMHRVQLDRMSDYLFAPTQHAAEILEAENHQGEIFLTGNTEMDALRWVIEKGEEVDSSICGDRPYVVVTAHRRENQEQLGNIAEALVGLALLKYEYDFIFPAHPTPKVQAMAKTLEGIENIKVVPPMSFDKFIPLVNGARLVLTDSGGLQEDGAYLNVPVLVMRTTTERPEAVSCGSAKMVGTGAHKIVVETLELLKNEDSWRNMATAPCPFGNGYAASMIVDHLEDAL